MKKLIALALTACLTSALLVGCGGTSTETSTSEQGSATTTEDTASTGDVDLTFSMWDPMPKDYNFVEKFMEKNPDINVEIVSFPDDNYSTKLNTMAAAGTEPDVMLVWECDVPNFAKDGVILSLDDFVDNSDTVKLDDLLPVMMTLQEMNGGTYGLPWGFATQIMYYNKDMFDAANIEYPTDDWTWDDYTEAAKALTIRDGENVSQWGEANIGHKDQLSKVNS